MTTDPRALVAPHLWKIGLSVFSEPALLDLLEVLRVPTELDPPWAFEPGANMPGAAPRWRRIPLWAGYIYRHTAPLDHRARITLLRWFATAPPEIHAAAETTLMLGGPLGFVDFCLAQSNGGA